jgi:predicted Zn-dependent protease
LKELVRLLKVQRAYQHMNNGDLAVEKGNMSKAMMEYSSAEELMPENMEMKFWKAVTMANNGNIQTASQILYRVYSDVDYGQNWRKLLARLPEVGLLTVSEDDIERLQHPEN